MPVDQRTLQNAENALHGIKMAVGRFDPPAEIATATAMISEIQKIKNAPAPTMTDLPADPTKLRAYLRKHATACSEHTAVIQASDEALDHYSRQVILLYRQVLPGWVDGLVDDFATEIQVFREALLDAPARTLTGYEDREQVESHLEVKRSAQRIENLINFRAAFGATVGESRITAPGDSWALVINPPPSAPAKDDPGWSTLHELAEVIASWPTGDWQTSSIQDRFRRLITIPALDIRLAALGEPATRVDCWDRLRAQGVQAAALPQLSPEGMIERNETAAAEITRRLHVMAAERATTTTSAGSRVPAGR